MQPPRHEKAIRLRNLFPKIAAINLPELLLKSRVALPDKIPE